MKVVITGATGNVGTSVLRVLSRDERVTEIVGIARRPAALELPKCRFVRADVSTDDLREHFAGASAVIHLAWMIQPERNPRLLERVNIRGSRNVFLAAAAANVPAILYSSSVGAYAAGPKDRTVEETWETSGIPSSVYSQQKAHVERLLNGFEREHPTMRVVRFRPALIFKRGAASEIRRYFLGPLAPVSLFKRERVLFVPDIEGLRFQCVHSLDVAEAFRLALVSDARGAFNLAAEPIIDPDRLVRLFEARRLRIAPTLARALASVSFRARLQRASPGWLDMALNLPIMDTWRARHELGWRPQWPATEALLEVFEGIHHGAGMSTPPLSPDRGGAAPV